MSESVHEKIFRREADDCASILNFCILADLPETAREIGRWIASIALEFYPNLRPDNRNKMCFWPKPYILHEYQRQRNPIEEKSK